MSVLTTSGRRVTTRSLLLALFGLWSLSVAAPCVMAAPACHEMPAPCVPADNDAPLPMSETGCETLAAADCQTRDSTALVGSTVTPDITALPPRLALLPHAALAPPLPDALPRAERYALRLTPPPLYLQHTVLLL